MKRSFVLKNTERRMTSQQKKIGKEQLVHHVPGKDIDRLDWLSLYKTPSSDVFEDKLEA